MSVTFVTIELKCLNLREDFRSFENFGSQATQNGEIPAKDIANRPFYSPLLLGRIPIPASQARHQPPESLTLERASQPVGVGATWQALAFKVRRMRAAPVSAPLAIALAIVIIGASASGSISLDVCKIEQHFVILLDVLAHHIIVPPQRLTCPAPIGMTGVIDVPHPWVIALELGHCIEIGLDLGIFIIGHLPAPGPQREIEPAGVRHTIRMVDPITGLPIQVRSDVSVSAIVIAIVNPQGCRIVRLNHRTVFVDIHIVFAIAPLQPFQPA